MIPGRIVIKHDDGSEDVYVPSFFLINTKDANGLPRLCTHLPEGHQMSLAGGEEFMLGYLPEYMVRKRG